MKCNVELRLNVDRLERSVMCNVELGSCGQIGEDCEVSCGASAHCGQVGEECEVQCGASAQCGQIGEECDV